MFKSIPNNGTNVRRFPMTPSCRSEVSATFGGKRDNNGRASTFSVYSSRKLFAGHADRVARRIARRISNSSRESRVGKKKKRERER